MTEERSAEASGPQRELALLRELEELVRHRDRRQQATDAEARRLRAAIGQAAARLEAMLGGERASRAALQAVADALRAAIAADDPADP